MNSPGYDRLVRAWLNELAKRCAVTWTRTVRSTLGQDTNTYCSKIGGVGDRLTVKEFEPRYRKSWLGWGLQPSSGPKRTRVNSQPRCDQMVASLAGTSSVPTPCLQNMPRLSETVAHLGLLPCMDRLRSGHVGSTIVGLACSQCTRAAS